MALNTAGMPGVSVIVPTFNRSRYIGAALDSILSQTTPPKQVIVVDDGSTDDTHGALARFGGRVKYLRKENGGKSSALNLGLRHVAEPLTWIFDDDDVAAPKALEVMSAALSDESLGFAYGPYKTFRSDEELTRLLNGMEQGTFEPDGSSLLPVFGLRMALMFHNFIMQPGLLVRTACYVEQGDFDERLVRAQDFEMLLRLTRAYRGTRVDNVLFYQRHHSGQRGSKAKPVPHGKLFEAWTSYDKLIFADIYRTRRLDEFLPDAVDETDLRGRERAALFVRGSVMARRHLWEEAANDFESALAAPAATPGLARLEVAALRQILESANPYPASVLQAKGFQTVVNGVPSRRLRREIRAALVYPLPYVLRARLQRRALREAMEILNVYMRLGTPSVVMHALAEKVGEKLRARRLAIVV
jgi:glycosyltransferase involved in cell wall biosynthesis